MYIAVMATTIKVQSLVGLQFIKVQIYRSIRFIMPRFPFLIKQIYIIFKEELIYDQLI
jgi:hypothetical protein